MTWTPATRTPKGQHQKKMNKAQGNPYTLRTLQSIADCYHAVSGNRIESDMISKSDPENPESPQVVIGDTNDSCGGDDDYNSSNPEDSDDSGAGDDQSVEYDSGLEENPHTRQSKKKKGDEGSVQSENSDSELEENPRAKRKGKGKGKGKGVKGRIDKRKKKKVIIIDQSHYHGS